MHKYIYMYGLLIFYLWYNRDWVSVSSITIYYKIDWNKIMEN